MIGQFFLSSSPTLFRPSLAFPLPATLAFQRSSSYSLPPSPPSPRIDAARWGLLPGDTPTLPQHPRRAQRCLTIIRCPLAAIKTTLSQRLQPVFFFRRTRVSRRRIPHRDRLPFGAPPTSSRNAGQRPPPLRWLFFLKGCRRQFPFGPLSPDRWASLSPFSVGGVLRRFPLTAQPF